MRFGLILSSLFVAVPAFGAGVDDALLTVAEQSNFKATARHADVMELCRKLSEKSPLVRLTEMGKTGEGRSIPMMIVADPPVTSPEEAARSGKLVALLLGDIHAGEVCGKEALPILVREIVENPSHPLLKSYVLLVAPIYNADGNERVDKNNRPGQVGPEEGMGQRGNAAGLDLNRDFIKLEAPESRALVRAFNEWDPHLFIDTHTTNGSRHRYVVTYEGPVNPNGDAKLRSYVRGAFFPGVTKAFKQSTGKDVFHYGNFDRQRTRWISFGSQPRFGTNYFGMRNRIGILSEAYAYASYKDRIFATRDFVKECLAFAAEHKGDVIRLLDEARRTTIARGDGAEHSEKVAIRSHPKALPEPGMILGFGETERNGRRVTTDEPKEYRLALEFDYEATESVRQPFAYLVPAKYSAAIETLQRHGLEAVRLREEKELDVEVYQLTGINHQQGRFQGHRETTLYVVPRAGKRKIAAGTLVIKTAHRLGSLAVYLLEPRSDDGLATWNFFDEGLEAGGDFPVVRLPRAASLVTAPKASLP
jgi:hypothetical protein